jgi:hypothetical protein
MNIDIEIIEFVELIDQTLSSSFLEKWRYKYSEKFIKLFQLKLLDALSSNKTIKIKLLHSFFTKKHKYSSDQVINFFESVDITLYHPLVIGNIEDV